MGGRGKKEGWGEKGSVQILSETGMKASGKYLAPASRFRRKEVMKTEEGYRSRQMEKKRTKRKFGEKHSMWGGGHQALQGFRNP